MSENTVKDKSYIGDAEVEEALAGYDPDISEEDFRKRYAGMYAKDEGKRMSYNSMRKIFNKFLRDERIDFFNRHDFSLEDVWRVGADKLIMTMGWTKPSHVKGWRNNAVRVGLCAHCHDQFVPLMFQTNHGLCHNCRPLYSQKAIQNFIFIQLNESERYYHAHRDMLMDFYIMFYNDPKLRKLFLKGTESAEELEEKDVTAPEWATNSDMYKDQQFDPHKDIIDVEAREDESDSES